MKKEIYYVLGCIGLTLAVAIFMLARIGKLEKKVESLYQAHVSDMKALTSIYGVVLGDYKAVIEATAAKSKIDVPAVVKKSREERAAVEAQGEKK